MPADAILYLSTREVALALNAIDVVDAVASALTAHARGASVLPAQAYLGWEHAGETLRSLSMPALVEGCPGVKLINSNAANPARGIPRASGLTVLFDIATGQPVCAMAGARISCLRTAAVTALAADLLGAHPIQRLALLGAGALARCHLELLTDRLPDLREICLYDPDRERATDLAADLDRAEVCGSPEEAIRRAQLIVAVTTTTSGYIRYGWLEPGALIVDVSLDDPLPEVVLRADKVFVDDWALVSADHRRLLGRMHRSGQISEPGNPRTNRPRPIDGELGELLTSTLAGRTRPEEIILVNPFGLALEDIAVARRVHEHALKLGLGTTLER